jgi:PIN domain nuclease of toxin-antitoxin system
LIGQRNGGAEKLYFIDTNVTIWLYQGELEKFSRKLKRILETNDIFVSPLVKLELQYLYEVKRIKKKSDHVISLLYTTIGLQSHNVPLNVLIEKSLSEQWTRDPFDRLITAHAKVENAYLITKDQSILSNYPRAIW